MDYFLTLTFKLIFQAGVDTSVQQISITTASACRDAQGFLVVLWTMTDQFFDNHVGITSLQQVQISDASREELFFDWFSDFVNFS